MLITTYKKHNPTKHPLPLKEKDISTDFWFQDLFSHFHNNLPLVWGTDDGSKSLSITKLHYKYTYHEHCALRTPPTPAHDNSKLSLSSYTRYLHNLTTNH